MQILSVTQASTVVGYNEIVFGQGETAVTLFDFLNVGGDEGHTLADITPVSVDGTALSYNNFNVIPLGAYAAGSPDILCDNEWLLNDELLNSIDGWQDFIADHELADTSFCYYSGEWYLSCDFEHTYPCSHFPVADGNGFVVAVGGQHRQGVKLVYSGQVPDADLPVLVGQSVTAALGNFAPMARTVADFVPVSKDGTAFSYNNFNLIPLGAYAAGSPDILCDSEWMCNDEKLNSIDGWQDFIADHELADVSFCYYNGGWYLSCDIEHTYECSHFPVDAAKGFVIAVGGQHRQGVTLTLPHAFK